MATTVPNGSFATLAAARNGRVRQHSHVAVHRPRKLTPEAGRAIEILAHAIEYLADEFALDCMVAGAKGYCGEQPRMKAIELMMERNREIYLSCPRIPTLAERLTGTIRTVFSARVSSNPPEPDARQS